MTHRRYHCPSCVPCDFSFCEPLIGHLDEDLLRLLEVRRGYEDPPSFVIRNQGDRALMLGVVMRPGFNGQELLDGGTSGISARPNLLRKQLAIRALVPLLRAPIVEGAVDALLGLVHCLFHPGCKGIQRRLRHEGYVGTRAVDANTPARPQTRWHDVVSAIMAGFGCCHLGAR